MNLEEMYCILKGASHIDGARFEVVEKWFRKCGIIDGIRVEDGLFEQSYLRLCPNKEPLGLVQFIQLIGILSRESKQEVQTFLRYFETITQEVIEEIQESHVGKDYAYS